MALVAITDSNLGAGIEEDVLAAAGHEVRRLSCQSADDVARHARDANALIVQWLPITARLFDALPDVRFVSRLGIGIDMVDVEAASARGVAVANTPDYCIDEVVAHTLAFILCATRGIVRHDRAFRAGAWDAIAPCPEATRPAVQRVAVVGLGRIGARVAAQLSALGYDVVGVDPAAPCPPGVTPSSLREALATADIITLHVPLTASTRHLIDAEALASMKATAVLVNTCRGPLVDEDALLAALDTGSLAGAMLDVYEDEPLAPDSRLRTAPQIVGSTHAAWYSPLALADLPRRAALQTADFLAGRDVPAIVNPEYRNALPEKEERWTTT